MKNSKWFALGMGLVVLSGNAWADQPGPSGSDQAANQMNFVLNFLPAPINVSDPGFHWKSSAGAGVDNNNNALETFSLSGGQKLVDLLPQTDNENNNTAYNNSTGYSPAWLVLNLKADAKFDLDSKGDLLRADIKGPEVNFFGVQDIAHDEASGKPNASVEIAVGGLTPIAYEDKGLHTSQRDIVVNAGPLSFDVATSLDNALYFEAGGTLHLLGAKFGQNTVNNVAGENAAALLASSGELFVGLGLDKNTVLRLTGGYSVDNSVDAPMNNGNQTGPSTFASEEVYAKGSLQVGDVSGYAQIENDSVEAKAGSGDIVKQTAGIAVNY